MNAADAVLTPAFDLGRGDAPALLFHERTWTYRYVLAEVNRAGHALLALGLQPDDRVVLMLRDSPALVTTYLGVMKAGGVAVSYNLRASSSELRFVLENSQAKLLVIEPDYMPVYECIAGALASPPQVLVTGDASDSAASLPRLAASQPEELTAVPREPDAMAFWLYTSGTTGTSKAAVHRQQDVLHAEPYLRDVLGVQAGDVLFATAKLFFAYALGTCLFGSFRLGATTLLHPEWPQPSAVEALIARHRPRYVFSVPAFYQAMLAAGGHGYRGAGGYVTAGERMPEALYARWEALTGHPPIDGIGTTETIYFFLTNRPGRERPGSVGTPAPGAEVALLDASGQPVTAPHQVGRLAVRMPSVCAGYWEQPARTEQALGDGWFWSGDLFSKDPDGFWYHEGREDDLMKLSGQWVSLQAVEEAVRPLDAVADVAAVWQPDPDGLPRLEVFIVAEHGAEVAATLTERVHEALRSALALIDVPRAVHYVAALPRTATGKVQRFRLRAAGQAAAG